MQELSALRFSQAARSIADEARRHGLVAPSFRTPPRTPGVRRALRRWPDGGGLVSVCVRGRASAEVLADMATGVVVLNRLTGDDARRAHRALVAAAEGRPEAA